MFHANPQKFIPGAFVKIGYFLTDDQLKFQDEVFGNIFDQIEKTMDLLFSKYIKAEISYSGINRIEKFEYPKEAIREALLNAIAHKDYSGSTPIQISVYKDKIIFWNEGKLPDDWTIENLLTKHPSKPFNTEIAGALFRSGYIEAWGRGTIKMLYECERNGLPRPEYFYNMSGFFVKFRKDIFSAEVLSGLGLNERQIKAVLTAKSNGKITNTEYQTLNNVSKRTASNELSELVSKFRLLEKTGSRGAGISYRVMGQ